MTKEYERLATTQEIIEISSSNREDMSIFLASATFHHENAIPLAVVGGIAYPIKEIADNH